MGPQIETDPLPIAKTFTWTLVLHDLFSRSQFATLNVPTTTTKSPGTQRRRQKIRSDLISVIALVSFVSWWLITGRSRRDACAPVNQVRDARAQNVSILGCLAHF